MYRGNHRLGRARPFHVLRFTSHPVTQGAYEKTDKKTATDQSSGHLMEVRGAEVQVPDGEQKLESIPPISVQGL